MGFWSSKRYTFAQKVEKTGKYKYSLAKQREIMKTLEYGRAVGLSGRNTLQLLRTRGIGYAPTNFFQDWYASGALEKTMSSGAYRNVEGFLAKVERLIEKGAVTTREDAAKMIADERAGVLRASDQHWIDELEDEKMPTTPET